MKEKGIMRRIDFLVIPSIIILFLAALAIDSYQPGALSLAGKPHDGRLLMAMGSFEGNVPGEALIWVLGPDGSHEELSLEGSNVCHRVLSADLDHDGVPELYAATGQNASVFSLTPSGNGWDTQLIWEPDCSRVRDLEAGDVDGDGAQELVAVTHLPGKIAVIRPDGAQWQVTELLSLNGTYIHEVELYDADQDGSDEIFSTPSEPNQAKGLSQPGRILMHSWNGTGFSVRELASFSTTHAKEISMGDPDNDGLPELLAAVQGNATRHQVPGEGVVKLVIETPLRIMLWDMADLSAEGSVITELPGIGARALAVGDANNDGLNELLLGTETAGLHLLMHRNGSWKTESIDSSLRGNIGGAIIADLNGDGLNEVVASSDSLGLVRSYSRESGVWQGETVLETGGHWVWAMSWGDAL